VATTPENAVKKKIREWLAKFGSAVSYLTPVPGPFGTTMGNPDFVFSFCGLFVAIEAKARGKKATKLQQDKLAELRASGALTYVVDKPDEQLPAIERGLIHRARLYRRVVEMEQRNATI
jgi:hypothetical protein